MSGTAAAHRGANGSGVLVETINPDSPDSATTAIDFTIDTLTYSAPEPASSLLLGSGLLGLGLLRRRHT